MWVTILIALLAYSQRSRVWAAAKSRAAVTREERRHLARLAAAPLCLIMQCKIDDVDDDALEAAVLIAASRRPDRDSLSKETKALLDEAAEHLKAIGRAVTESA